MFYKVSLVLREMTVWSDPIFTQKNFESVTSLDAITFQLYNLHQS